MSWVRQLATHKPTSKAEGFVAKMSLADFKEPNAEVAREIKRRARKHKKT